MIKVNSSHVDAVSIGSYAEPNTKSNFGPNGVYIKYLNGQLYVYIPRQELTKEITIDNYLLFMRMLQSESIGKVINECYKKKDAFVCLHLVNTQQRSSDVLVNFWQDTDTKQYVAEIWNRTERKIKKISQEEIFEAEDLL